MDPACRIAFAHYGYIYALTIIPRPNNRKWLVSGSGDSDFKIWDITPRNGLELIRTVADLPGAVLSLAVRDNSSLLFAGLQDGDIKVWDLETGACIRSIQVHEMDVDVLSMSVLGSDVYTAGGDGEIIRVNEEFDCTARFGAHTGSVLSSVIVKAARSSGDKVNHEDDDGVELQNGKKSTGLIQETGREAWELITAGNDSFVKVSHGIYTDSFLVGSDRIAGSY